jgi:hypothetical protein
MSAYNVCPACARHVKSHDATCPWCGARMGSGLVPTPLRRPRLRASRAQWLAYGAACAVLGCTETGPTRSSPGEAGSDGVPIQEASVAGDADIARDLDAAHLATDGAAEDASISDSSLDAATTAMSNNSPFLCAEAGFAGDAAVVCDSQTQYCHLHSGNASGATCQTLPFACLAYPPLPDAGMFCQFSAASSCDAGLRCSCIALGVYNAAADTCWACADNDAGGLTMSCGSCYGAPPARLEKVA